VTERLANYLSTIIGISITIAFSLVSDFILKLPKEITWLTFFTGSIITVSVTMLEQKLIDRMSEDLNKKIQIYSILENIKDPELYQIAQTAISECEEKLKSLEEGIIPTAEYSHHTNRLTLCHKSFQAIYWANTPESLYKLKDTFAGRNYYELNIEAVKRGVKIERIFILKKSDMLGADGKFQDKKAIDIIKNQQQNGINIRVCWNENLIEFPDSKNLFRDFGIIDNVEVIEQLYGAGGSRPGSKLIKQKYEVKKCIDVWQKLWRVSRPLEEILS